MPVSRPLLLTCAIALLVSGCDRQSAPPAQPRETAVPATSSGETAQLTGKIDRSFAGRPLPDVEVKDAAGKSLALASLAGKPVLVNLWATWCAPCVVEMPLLDRIAQDMDGRLSVVTVSEDFDGALVAPFFAKKGYRHLPQWLDPGNAVVMAYGGDASLPLSVLYDSTGKEVWRVTGGYDWASDAARKALAESGA